MNEIDEKIIRALDAEDRALLEQLGEQGLLGQFESIFKGKMAWVSVASMIAGSVLTFIFFYAAWKFFTVVGVEARLTWFAIGWYCAIMVAFMKVWFWMRMESNRVIREVKRVELQLARLGEKRAA